MLEHRCSGELAGFALEWITGAVLHGGDIWEGVVSEMGRYHLPLLWLGLE